MEKEPDVVQVGSAEDVPLIVFSIEVCVLVTLMLVLVISRSIYDCQKMDFVSGKQTTI